MAHPMQKYFDDIVASISSVIQFDSSFKGVEGENGEYPFGKETADCLQFFLSLAESFGFETKNYDNYIGEVIFGEGEEFAILAHLDVVPAGNGWKYPPFGGVINDDVSVGGVTGKKIWGRGAMDDKGPAVVCLYALKALKDEGFTPRRKIKLIVGCNEECGCECVEHYKKVAHMPDEGFTPDANFPVIYAEKGIVHIASSFPINNSPVTGLSGGERANVVCDFVSAFLTRKAAEALVGYQNPIEGTTLSYDNTTNTLTAHGRAAHGSTPEYGANALQAMFAFLATINDDFAYVNDVLFNDALGLKVFQDETGLLTMSPDVAKFENGMLHVVTDIRFPATFALESVTERFKNAGIPYQINSYLAPLYNDINSTLITTLLRVFNEKTGGSFPAIAIGGGTYARELKCGCAFGPEIPFEETTIHQANEYITFERIHLISEVYYDAIKELTKPHYTPVAHVTMRRIKK